ncbi:Processing alpha glucosidase I [Coemansia sp. S146]|nr:Processing alpha glucosidase I [Coemansia sp. S146]
MTPPTSVGGTYRPYLYFGTRSQLPNSLLGDNLSEYGYSRHNGRDFGEQTMRNSDQGVEIKSTFMKVPGQLGGSWAVRFTGQTLNKDTQWDSDLSLEIICSWFSTMDSNGWMVCKQILGDEARSKVPREFQVQYPDFANPPTIIFAGEATTEQLLAQGMARSVDDVLQAEAIEEEVSVLYEVGLLRIDKLSDNLL